MAKLLNGPLCCNDDNLSFQNLYVGKDTDLLALCTGYDIGDTA
jgi:hypothetical protein